jgi:hypothetical protein
MTSLFINTPAAADAEAAKQVNELHTHIFIKLSHRLSISIPSLIAAPRPPLPEEDNRTISMV